MSEAFAVARRLTRLSVRQSGSSQDLRSASRQGRREAPSLWDCDPSGVTIECGAERVIVGETWQLEFGFADQLVIKEAFVRSVNRTASGSHIVRYDFQEPDQKRFDGQQRRGNVRWVANDDFRPLCYVVDPCVNSIHLPARILDFSISGMAFEAADSTISFISGLTLACQVVFPFSEQFETAVHVRRVTLSKQRGYLTVHCEFDQLTDGHAATIIRYAIRFGPANETEKLIRSQSVRGNLSDLVSFDSHVDKDEYEKVRLDLGPANGLAPEADQHACTNVVAHLGTFPIATIRFSLGGRPSKSELRVADFVVRSELRDSGIMAVLSSFVADAYHRFGVDALSLCDDARDLFPRKTSTKPKRGPKYHLGNGSTFDNPVSWSDYAAAYDVMCDANPAYAENLGLFSSWLRELELPPSAKICDVGAGTGNYVLGIAKQLPEARIFHLERDPVMNRLASQKYSTNGVSNVSFVIADIHDHAFEENSFDVILIVNSLYSLANPWYVLQKLHAALKPGAHLFTIDLGRAMNVLDWSKYIAISNIKKHGVRRTIRSFYRARHAITQNRAIRNAQDRGQFWQHTPAEFRDLLEDSGFELISLQTCYRGYCDAAVCRKIH